VVRYPVFNIEFGLGEVEGGELQVEQSPMARWNVSILLAVWMYRREEVVNFAAQVIVDDAEYVLVR